MTVFEDIMTGLEEAVSYEKGELKARTAKCIVAEAPQFGPAEVKEVRQMLNMTQNTFAAVMGVSPKTVEAWEAGTNTPLGPSRRMLSLLKDDPALLQKHRIIAFPRQ